MGIRFGFSSVRAFREFTHVMAARAMLAFVTVCALCMACAIGQMVAPLQAHAKGSLAAGDSQLEEQTESVMFNCVDVASGSVKWDAGTNTVTMTDAVIDLSNQSELHQYATCAFSVDAINTTTTPTVTLELVGQNKISGGDVPSYAIQTSGSNLKIVGPGTLNVIGSNGSTGFFIQGDLTMASGTVALSKVNDGILMSGNFRLDGGALSINDATGSIVSSEGSATLAKGSIYANGVGCGISSSGAIALKGAVLNVKNALDGAVLSSQKEVVLAEGSLVATNVYGAVQATGPVTLSGATVTVTNASEDAVYAAGPAGSFTARSGQLKVKGSSYGISCDKAFTMKGAGARISMSSLSQAGVFCGRYAQKAGSLSVSKCVEGVQSLGGIAMNGGKLTVTKSSGAAIDGAGKVKFVKGALTVKCADPAYQAIYGGKGVSVKAGVLKAAVGVLDKGVAFKTGGNTYVANGLDPTTGAYTVALKSYGSPKKAATVNTLNYGKVTYAVTAIGAKAFSTKKGKAITSLTLGANVRSVGKNAFYGTAKLAKLNLRPFDLRNAKLNKKAFAKCGKKSGAKLTVTCVKGAVKKTRKALVKAGLSKKTRFK